jgi:hypothetical protein
MNEVCEAVIATITPNGSTAIPFVIPSEAEGSAVHSTFATQVHGKMNSSLLIRRTADPSAGYGAPMERGC